MLRPDQGWLPALRKCARNLPSPVNLQRAAYTAEERFSTPPIGMSPLPVLAGAPLLPCGQVNLTARSRLETAIDCRPPHLFVVLRVDPPIQRKGA